MSRARDKRAINTWIRGRSGWYSSRYYQDCRWGARVDRAFHRAVRRHGKRIGQPIDSYYFDVLVDYPEHDRASRREHKRAAGSHTRWDDACRDDEIPF